MSLKLSLRILVILPIALVATGPSLMGQENGVLGYWREPEGSVIHIETCGKDVCATLVALSSSAPGRVDGKNPDPKLRNRSLCGLRLGEAFT
jgi:uncharacterized protein (DUF2147 family)